MVITLVMLMSISFVFCDNSNMHRNAQKLGLSIPKGEKKATDIKFHTIDKEIAKLSDYKGKVIILNLWATWCVPCGMEMPSMEKLHKRFAENDFVMIALNVENNITKDKITKYLNKHNYTFMVAHDTFYEGQQNYFTGSTPITYIIGKDFNIKGRVLGTVDWYSQPAISLIEELINN